MSSSSVIAWGGMVIAGAADASPDRIRHLVYLDAVTPSDGQSLFDCLPEYRDTLRQIAKSVGDDWLVSYPVDYGTFGVSDENDVKWLTERLTPHPLACYDQKVRFRNPSALALPRPSSIATDTRRWESKNTGPAFQTPSPQAGVS